MECRNRIFAKTKSLCIALFGIAIFASSCESKEDLSQPTPQATTKAPKQCSFNNINYRVGENWNPFLLPKGYYRCITCICELKTSIAVVTCSKCRKPPPGNGKNPANKQQKNCTHKSIGRNHGAVWAEPARNPNLLQANQCKECSCTDGFTTCAIRDCPVLSCKNQTNIDGACCPVCAGDLQRPHHPAGCQTMGRYYDHMETWYPRIPPRYDMCINCTCKNSTIECRNHDCPKITCDNPQRKPGACCDSCPANSVRIVKEPSSSSPMESIRSLIRLKVRQNPGECEWGKEKYPHNSSFHPTVGPFVVYCVKCVCNASKLNCVRLICPTPYPCKTPVYVAGKCCKVCNDNGDGTIPEIPTTGSSAKRPCSSGKYWMVYEYSHGKQRNIKSEIRVQFVLEDRERRAVEIHTINANMTVKTVKVSNMTKRHFDLINSNNEYKDLGKIREVQRNKIKIWEQRACHLTYGCIHTVQKIMERLRERVRKCDSSMHRPPDSLLKLDEGL
ncbi:Chordin-like [Desmophyllum pertusum]|uniref:Chordin-like n=1 Tax=Desmophyllum pertusum TaxID=174260 RepID=A0A9X0CJY8_9CNID|nr:Chordin-like [Desmophyllum pertusum]